MALAPTTEQSNILSLAKSTGDNLMVDALAGTGKSSTIRMVEAALRVPMLYLVFGKKNAEEAEREMTPLTKIKTMNSLGHMVWGTGRRLTLEKDKTQKDLRWIISEMKSKSDQNAIWDIFWPVVAAVGLAKNIGYVPEGHYPTAKRIATQEELHSLLDEPPSDFTSEIIDAVLLLSIRDAFKGRINYDDQVYMPAVFGGAYPKFPVVAVDEYQDLNPCNHVMIRGLMKRGSRLIGVGDPAQNIYGFRGAKAGGMKAATAEYSMTRCDLSVSFRCPEAIVRHVRWRVPHFKWFRDGGHVSTPRELHAEEIDDDATIICRNNAPLLHMALRLLSRGRSVSVAGSDVGPRLVSIMKRLGDDDMSRDSLLSAIEDWRAEKLAAESKTANDTADCMRVFAMHGSTLGSAITYAEHLFRQDGAIRFLTGHKSKGLEFDNVIHLDPWLCKTNNEQDRNLKYVINTRSRDRLTEIDSEAIRW